MRTKITVWAVVLEELLFLILAVLVLVSAPIFPVGWQAAICAMHQWQKDGNYLKWWWPQVRSPFISNR